MRSSRLGPLNSAGSGGNWPTPVMEPQAARLRASSWEEPSRCMAPTVPSGRMVKRTRVVP